MQGLTLIELMVSMAIGLILIAVCLAMFQSAGNTYAATESLSRMQEGQRLAFEMMAGEVREAGQNACDKSVRTYNVLNDSASWFSAFDAGIRGYAGNAQFPEHAFESGLGRRIYGTPAIELKSAASDPSSVDFHDPTSATITIGSSGLDFSAGDIVVACDFGQLAVLQLTGASAASRELRHLDGSGSPGNCSKGLGWSPARNCTSAGNIYAYGCYRGAWGGADCKDEHPKDGVPDRWPASVARLKATRWFLGRNERAGHSLFRMAIQTRNGTPETVVEEVLPNITDLDFSYMLEGTQQYVEADAVAEADWRNNRVSAVKMAVTVASPEKIHGASPQRRFENVVAVRRSEP